MSSYEIGCTAYSNSSELFSIFMYKSPSTYLPSAFFLRSFPPYFFQAPKISDFFKGLSWTTKDFLKFCIKKCQMMPQKYFSSAYHYCGAR